MVEISPADRFMVIRNYAAIKKGDPTAPCCDMIETTHDSIRNEFKTIGTSINEVVPELKNKINQKGQELIAAIWRATCLLMAVISTCTIVLTVLILTLREPTPSEALINGVDELIRAKKGSLAADQQINGTVQQNHKIRLVQRVLTMSDAEISNVSYLLDQTGVRQQVINTLLQRLRKRDIALERAIVATMMGNAGMLEQVGKLHAKCSFDDYNDCR